MVRAFFLILVLVLPSIGFAEIQTTTGNLLLYQTFESVGVRCSYSGDDNNSASAVVEYKVSSNPAWITAHAPYLEKRTTRPLYHFAITSLFYLTPGEKYDVRITFFDQDGVAGANPVIGQVTTWNHYPPTVGSTCNATVSNWTELNNALSACNGRTGTITLNSGNYGGADRVISINGSGVSGFVKIASATPLGAYFSDQVSISGDYLWVHGIDFRNSSDSGTTEHGLVLNSAQYTVIDACKTGKNVFIEGSPLGMLLNNNTIRSGCGADGDCSNSSLTHHNNCVMLNGSTAPLRFVARNNDVSDCRDGFGINSGDDWDEVDFHNNYVHDYADDGFEMDGNSHNARVFNNYTYGSGMVSSVSTNPIPGGPLWIVNNIFAANVGNYAQFKTGHESEPGVDGPVYIYFNTIYTPNAASAGRGFQAMNNPDSRYFTLKNNIIKANGSYWLQSGGCGWRLENNNWDPNGVSSQKVDFHYYDSTCGNEVGYSSYAAWKSAKAGSSYGGITLGMLNEKNVDSLMTDPEHGDFTLQTGSLLRDAGVFINGIFKDYYGNNRNLGTAPDIGAIESTGLSSPHNVRIVLPN